RLAGPPGVFTMLDLATILPARRPELVFSPAGDGGTQVVRDPHTGTSYRLGEQESFLLARLDGRHTAQAVCADFAARFGGPLSREELHEFLALARANGLLRPEGPGADGRLGLPVLPPGATAGHSPDAVSVPVDV